MVLISSSLRNTERYPGDPLSLHLSVFLLQTIGLADAGRLSARHEYLQRSAEVHEHVNLLLVVHDYAVHEYEGRGRTS